MKNELLKLLTYPSSDQKTVRFLNNTTFRYFPDKTVVELTDKISLELPPDATNLTSSKAKYSFEGCEYIGSVLNGLRHGKGELTMGELKYVGEFFDGMKHGFGTITYGPNGGSYEGYFKEGKKNGKGIRKFPGGNIYKGDYKNDERQGEGVMYWVNTGEKYKGFWDKNKRKGFGMYNWEGVDRPFANRFVGFWEDDLKEGIGIWLYGNGNYFCGSWKADEKDGLGFMVDRFGKQTTLQFSKGKSIKVTPGAPKKPVKVASIKRMSNTEVNALKKSNDDSHEQNSYYSGIDNSPHSAMNKSKRFNQSKESKDIWKVQTQTQTPMTSTLPATNSLPKKPEHITFDINSEDINIYRTVINFPSLIKHIHYDPDILELAKENIYVYFFRQNSEISDLYNYYSKTSKGKPSTCGLTFDKFKDLLVRFRCLSPYYNPLSFELYYYSNPSNYIFRTLNLRIHCRKLWLLHKKLNLTSDSIEKLERFFTHKLYLPLINYSDFHTSYQEFKECLRQQKYQKRMNLGSNYFEMKRITSIKEVKAMNFSNLIDGILRFLLMQNRFNIDNFDHVLKAWLTDKLAKIDYTSEIQKQDVKRNVFISVKIEKLLAAKHLPSLRYPYIITRTKTDLQTNFNSTSINNINSRQEVTDHGNIQTSVPEVNENNTKNTYKTIISETGSLYSLRKICAVFLNSKCVESIQELFPFLSLFQTNFDDEFLIRDWDEIEKSEDGRRKLDLLLSMLPEKTILKLNLIKFLEDLESKHGSKVVQFTQSAIVDRKSKNDKTKRIISMKRIPIQRKITNRASLVKTLTLPLSHIEIIGVDQEDACRNSTEKHLMKSTARIDYSEDRKNEIIN